MEEYSCDKMRREMKNKKRYAQVTKQERNKKKKKLAKQSNSANPATLNLQPSLLSVITAKDSSSTGRSLVMARFSETRKGERRETSVTVQGISMSINLIHSIGSRLRFPYLHSGTCTGHRSYTKRAL